MMQQLTELGARIDAFSVRERALIMVTVLVGLFIVWNTALMTPLDGRERDVRARIDETRVQLAKLAVEEKQVVARGQGDPDAAQHARLEALQDELTQVENELAGTTENLIPPEKMPSVLERVLNTTQGVELVSLQGLGAVPLITSDEPGTSEREPTGGPLAAAFKHGLSLEVKGGYLETLALLRELEALPWAFFWESVDLKVNDYPDTRTQIRVFTLSLSKDWIGV